MSARTLGLGVVLSSLMAAPLWAPPLALACETTGEGVMKEAAMTKDQIAQEDIAQAQEDDGAQGKPTQARSSARASASASASATAGDAQQSGKCRAESSATAEATAGDEHAFDQDHDFAVQEDDGCRAQSESKASATVGGDG